MPKLTMNTLQNWIARGGAARPMNGALDVRDVAEWWDNARRQKWATNT